jgi:hypothetical protein
MVAWFRDIWRCSSKQDFSSYSLAALFTDTAMQLTTTLYFNSFIASTHFLSHAAQIHLPCPHFFSPSYVLAIGPLLF